MNRIEVPVTANISDIQKKIEGLGKTIEKVSRVKWSPIDAKAIERDIASVERRIINAGKRAESGGGADPDAGGIRHGVRRRYTYAPELRDVGRTFVGAVGGPVGQIAGYATRGAAAGATAGKEGGAGSLLGGVSGLLKGLGIGALVAGALKLGQAAGDGYDSAKERAFTLDSLKRQMGDLGVSFSRLKDASQDTAYSLGINSKDFAVVMADFNKLSRGADKTPEELGADAATSVGFARSFGIDPNQSNQFFGSMKGMDAKQNNRELALMLAEAINRSHMGANAEAVLQAVQSFASATSRLNLAPANTEAYLGAYSDMMSKNPGMTPDAAQGLLGQADASIRNMGNGGEAGKAFTLAAFNKGGYMNPIEAQAEAQGGLFASRRSMFGADTPMGKFFGKEGARIAGSKDADKTNIEMFMDHLRATMGDNPSFIMGGLMSQLGMTGSQAAAFANMQARGGTGLGKQLRQAGIDVNSVNPTNYQGVAEVAGAGSRDELMRLRQGMLKNKNLSDPDRATLEGVSSGTSDQDLKTTMLKIAANTAQESTSATAARDTAAATERMATSLGDHVFDTFSVMKDALVKQAFGGKKGYENYKFSEITADEEDRNAEIHERFSRGKHPRYAGKGGGAISANQVDPAEALELHQSAVQADNERKALGTILGVFTLNNKDGTKAAPDVTATTTIPVPRAMGLSSTRH